MEVRTVRKLIRTMLTTTYNRIHRLQRDDYIARKWGKFIPLFLSMTLVFYVISRWQFKHQPHQFQSKKWAAIVGSDPFVNQDAKATPVNEKKHQSKSVGKASWDHGTPIHVFMDLPEIGNDSQKTDNAKDTMATILRHSTRLIHFHVNTDLESTEKAKDLIIDASVKGHKSCTFGLEDLDAIRQNVRRNLNRAVPQNERFQRHLVDQMLPLVLHYHFTDLQRVILVSPDLKFDVDVADLNALFDSFSKDQLVGFTLNQNLKSQQDNPGFNADLILLDLDKMRYSMPYLDVINLERYFALNAKGNSLELPTFQHWMDLIRTNRSELFYTIGCQWNVQQKNVTDPALYRECKEETKAWQSTKTLLQ